MKAESVTAPVVLDGSLAPITSANVPLELLHLLRQMLIVVLVPRTTVDERRSTEQTLRHMPVVQIENSSAHTSHMPAAMAQFQGTSAIEVAVFGEVSVSFSTMEVRRTGKPVVLTPKAFQMLEYLIKHPRKVISRDELLNRVWGYNCYPCTRTIDNHMLALRRKLEPEPSKPKHFLTVHGVGYKFLP